ncbi:hypothetical protein ZIOFF_043343 [Zingiber officinale]|uniref:Uncharacterized protein n=1 Tax=Zingiber officinale TaxID=94328 RepID=A0A8J5KPX2_ZINOF|nr:hypothetical protein ZIOFF_043343 [Zingiber officinale]
MGFHIVEHLLEFSLCYMGFLLELNSKDKAWHAEDFLRFQVFLGRILCNSSVELGGVTMFPNDGDFNVVSQMMERFESSKLISNLSLACCAFYQLSELVIFLELVTGFEELKLLWKGGPSPLIIDPMVIEDMSIQVNVPALAMEEVAPLAVSDAAMLALEEIFHGKGNIKEEAELTKEERKRRRANQKRRFRRLKGDFTTSMKEKVLVVKVLWDKLGFGFNLKYTLGLEECLARLTFETGISYLVF